MTTLSGRMEVVEAGGLQISRRGSLSAGRGAAVGGRGRTQAPAARTPPAPPLTLGEGDSCGLGARLGAAGAALLAACGPLTGARVLTVETGDGGLAELAVASGAGLVVATDARAQLVERGRERVPEANWRCAPATLLPGDFDAVAAFFGATYVPDQRRLVAALVSSVRPGGRIAIAAWTGEVAERLRAWPGRGTGRPDAWCRLETAYRHFFDFPDLDVREEEVYVSGAPELPGLDLARFAVVSCTRP